MITKTKNLIIVDWNPQQLRYVWAESLGNRIRLKSLGCISASEPETAGTATEPMNAMLQNLRQQLNIRKADVIVVLPRAEIEENQTSLPTAANDEFHQLAFNQAHDFWHELADSSVVDYYSLDSTEEGMREVSLVLLPMEKKRFIEKTVEATGWKVSAIHLRHLNSTNLLRKRVHLDHPISVFVNLNQQSVDVVVLAQHQIALIRTISVAQATSSPAEIDRLKLEIQRSLMMIPPQEPDRELQPVPLYLLAHPEDLSVFCQHFESDSSFAVTLKNPFEFFEMSPGLAVDQVHEYSSLLGGLVESSGDHSINLMAPKCQKKISSLYRRVATYGLAVTLLGLLLIYVGRSSVSEAQQRNAELRQEIKKVESQTADLKKRTAAVDYISRWENEDVNWLEELRSLSLKFPGRDKTQVRSMTMSIGSNRRGVVSMNVRASDETVISNLEQAIRSEFHQVRTNSLSQASSEGNYGWQFGAVVSIVPRTRLDLIEDPLLSKQDTPPRNGDRFPFNLSQPIDKNRPTADPPDAETGSVDLQSKLEGEK